MTAKNVVGNGSLAKGENELYNETLDVTSGKVNKAQARSFWEEVGKIAVNTVKTIASVPQKEGVYARARTGPLGTPENQYCATIFHEVGHEFETDEYATESLAKKYAQYLKNDDDRYISDFAAKAYIGFEEIEEETGLKLNYDDEIDTEVAEVYKAAASGKIPVHNASQQYLRDITDKNEFVYGANDNGKIYVDSNLSKAWKQWKGFSLN